MQLCAQLVCNICKSMLSVPPIYLNEDGKSICSRCKSNVTCKTYIRNIHYENLAVQFHFPCRYYRNGCFIKKPFGVISVHEDFCPFQLMKCPLTTCLWSGNSAEFIIHYNEIHSNLIIEGKKIIKELILNTETCYVLYTNELHFLLKCIVQELHIKIKVTSLNFLNEQGDNTFTCCLRLSVPDSNQLEISEYLKLNEFVTINFSDILNDNLGKPIVMSINANLSQELINKRLDELNSIKCSMCTRYMTPPILSCPNNHYSCINCIGVDFDFCMQCAEGEVRFQRLRDLELQTVSHVYTCKWKECSAKCTYAQIEAHEQSCCKRLFMCVHCYDWQGSLNELVLHDNLCPCKTLPWHMIEATQFEVLGEKLCTSHYVLVAFKEQFFVEIQINDNNTIDVSASSFGPIACYDWYEYEIDLVQAENTTFPFNKTFPVKNRRGNEYHIRLLESSINEFGGLKFCKIIFRILLLNVQDRCKKKSRNLNRFNR